MNNNLQRDAIAAAIDVLNEERVIAYPTEAVFGVGCDPDSETAVMIGAGSLVPQNKRLESGYLYLGSPVKQIRPLSDEEKAGLRYSANNYVKWKDEYLDQGNQTQP